MSPPNWLLITFDQWRGDWLHQDWLDVPSIRKVASQDGMFVIVILRARNVFLLGQAGLRD